MKRYNCCAPKVVKLITNTVQSSTFHVMRMLADSVVLREFSRERNHQGMGPLKMKMALDFEGNDSQNRTCCAQNVFPDGKNVILPMSNLIQPLNRIAVIMRVFFRT